jgi:FkbM family methyltransferase
MGLMGFVDKYFLKKPRLRRLLTKWYYGDADKTVHIFSSVLYINSIKENGYLRAYEYANKSSVFKDEVTILINLAQFISNDTTFVDVGANVGLYSSTYARFQQLYHDLHIYAFEANPDTFKRLQKTTEGRNIQIFNVALSDKDDKLEFVQGVVSHVFAEKTYLRPHHLKHQKTVQIAAKRLDGFAMKGNAMVLKIDVEGHEYQVLEGARQLFEANRVKAVYLDGYRKGGEIFSFLKSFNFVLLDGKTLAPVGENNFSLLAIKQA